MAFLGGGPLLSLTPAPSRSPPRPSPGSLHYSDEDVTKYNDLIPAESSSLTEKPSEISDSQVRGGSGDQALPRPWACAMAQNLGFFASCPLWSPRKLTGNRLWTRRPPPKLCSEFAPGLMGACNLDQRRAPKSPVL